MRKLDAHCIFIPPRYRLPVSQLRPLLRGMYASEVSDPERDIDQLINDIHGITRKSPLGAPPPPVNEASNSNTGYSPAALAVAKVFVERTSTATADFETPITEIQEATCLSDEDVEDALDELAGMVQQLDESVVASAELYASFDHLWKAWRPPDDALCLAADLVNDKTFPRRLSEIAERYGWEARRLNPAVAYLLSQKIVRTYPGLGFQPWLTGAIATTPETRRFVRSRS